MQDGLYQLLKNKLSPKLVPLSKLQAITSKLRSSARKRGYELAINSPSDIYMWQTSFLAYENGELIVLPYLPMYKNKHLMKYSSDPTQQIEEQEELIQSLILELRRARKIECPTLRGITTNFLQANISKSIKHSPS